MTFKVVDNPTFRWPVTFKWAEDKEYTEHTFTAVFKRMKATDLAEKVRHIHEDGYSLESRIEFLDEVVKKFEDVSHDGTDEQLREYMFSDAAIINAMYETYCRAVAGVATEESAERKNSETPPSE